MASLGLWYSQYVRYYRRLLLSVQNCLFFRCTRVLSDRFITDGDKEWFDVELTNTLEKELGEEAADIIKEPRYFVDFMRDAPEPTGEEVRSLF